MTKDDLASLRKKKERRRRRRTLLLSAVSIVLVAVLIAALVLVLNSNSTNIRLAFFNTDTIAYTVQAQGLIVREEIQLLAPENGYFLPLYQSGSKVNINDRVGVVLGADYEDIFGQLTTLEKEIYSRQNELIRINNVQPGVIDAKARGQYEIISVMATARLAAGTGSIADIIAAKEEVQRTINMNSYQLRQLEIDDEELKALKNQYRTLLSGLKQGKHGAVITNPEPGWISYRNDSTTTIKPDDLLTNDYDQLHQQYAASNTTNSKSDPAQVGYNDTALTLITGQVQYLAFFLPECDSQDFPADKTYKIQSAGLNQTLSDCKIVRSEDGAEGLFIVFSTRSSIDKLADYVQEDFVISLSEQKGLIMPIASLLEYAPEQNAARIIKIVGGRTEIVPVIVEATDGFYVLIKGREGDPLAPKEADIYVRNPENVEAGIIIE